MSQVEEAGADDTYLGRAMVVNPNWPAPQPLPGQPKARPGLYPDPAEPDAQRRWWDGEAWGEETAPHVIEEDHRDSGWWEFLIWLPW